MNDIQNYLNGHYQTLEQFANASAISPDEIHNLIDQQLIPAPSYTVLSSNKCISQAFGELTSSNLVKGKYFHPGNRTWVMIAIESRKRIGAVQAHSEIKQQFRDNFAAELKVLNSNVFSLKDSFTHNGQVIEDGLNARTIAAWDYFLKGVFSLCVADP